MRRIPTHLIFKTNHKLANSQDFFSQRTKHPEKVIHLLSILFFLKDSSFTAKINYFNIRSLCQ